MRGLFFGGGEGLSPACAPGLLLQWFFAIIKVLIILHMQPVSEKRVLPGVEAGPAASAEMAERVVSVEVNPAASTEVVEQSAAEVETVDGVRKQLARGDNVSGTEKAGGSDEDGAVVIVFPDAKERMGFEGQATEGKVLTLLHTHSAIANPGATIHLLQQLPKAA